LTYRIEKHLNKEFAGSYTSIADDWELYFYIDDLEYTQARNIEAHIKKMKSRTYIENLKKYPEISEKLKLKYV
jgi:putative endonuclease